MSCRREMGSMRLIFDQYSCSIQNRPHEKPWDRGSLTQGGFVGNPYGICGESEVHMNPMEMAAIVTRSATKDAYIIQCPGMS